RSGCRDAGHQDEREHLRNQVVAILRRKPDCKIKYGESPAGQPVGIARITVAEPLPANQKPDADGDPDQHTSARAYPLVVKRVLQKKRDAKTDRDYSDSIEPVSTDARFEIRTASPRRWGLSGDTSRRALRRVNPRNSVPRAGRFEAWKPAFLLFSHMRPRIDRSRSARNAGALRRRSDRPGFRFRHFAFSWLLRHRRLGGCAAP